MFEIFKDAAGEWRWRLTSGGKAIAASAEGYRRRHVAVNAVEALKKLAPTAGVVEVLPLRGKDRG